MIDDAAISVAHPPCPHRSCSFPGVHGHGGDATFSPSLAATPLPLGQPLRFGHFNDREIRYPTDRRRYYAGDPVLDSEAPASGNDLTRLASSPHWQDRIRAEVLRQELTITLPDGFPCLYETYDSPSRTLSGRAPDMEQFVWVASPDLAMLEALLPDYQALWDAYTSQWGDGSRRVFEVGPLDGVPPRGVYVEGTTPAQVLAATVRTHSDMRSRMPERIREMVEGL